MEASWILSAPLELRISFIQGLTDGDGFISSYVWLGISTRCNADYYKKLLDTVNIPSRVKKKEIVITQRDSIIRAAEMPFFRYASGRLKKLVILKDITLAVSNNGYNNRVTSEEKSYILELRQRGLSYYQVRYHLWTEYGIGRSVSTIRRHCQGTT